MPDRHALVVCFAIAALAEFVGVGFRGGIRRVWWDGFFALVGRLLGVVGCCLGGLWAIWIVDSTVTHSDLGDVDGAGWLGLSRWSPGLEKREGITS